MKWLGFAVIFGLAGCMNPAAETPRPIVAKPKPPVQSLRPVYHQPISGPKVEVPRYEHPAAPPANRDAE